MCAGHGTGVLGDDDLPGALAVVSRADLRRLADRAQVAGPEMEHAWAAYRAAGMERLTSWQAFVAGIRAAAEWRRG